ncbi:KOW domain-containing protein [Xylaria telfairii]|nr:KOW domain-containing protein [Xylaria telfairii]
MQKIARRVATAERVVAKRRKARDDASHKKDVRFQSRQIQEQRTEAKGELERAKQAIRDDWAMGALSPRRDVGDNYGGLGSISHVRFSAAGDLSLSKRNARCQWAGGAHYLNLAVGDRVVLLDGPEKGRIGKIRDINHSSAEVTVSELNKTNARVPEWMRGKNDPVTTNIELPLPISAVRLVHPITDPITGSTRDVIINQLVHRGLVVDRQTGKRRWDRVVPGPNISIPWPAKEEPDIPDYKADTLRIDVEEKTFVPTLLRPPMPETIIDELRNKYSRFRTRHEPEYIARVEAEEQAKKDRAKLIESMRTPLQEFHRAERDKKKKKGKPRLTMEMLEKIGEVIAKNREKALNAAGVSDVPSPSGTSPPDVSPSTSANTESSAPPPST